MHMSAYSSRSNNWIDSFPDKTSRTGHAEEGMRGAGQTGGQKEVSEMHSEEKLEKMFEADEQEQTTIASP